MPENERPLFHDLLKGFEEFAKLKGYNIAFSIDSTFEGRIGFKFTIKDEGITVGAERVRKDFAEYVDQVRNKDIDDLDNMPPIITVEEHNLVVTMLKNRISFLRHNHALMQNAVRFYETMIANAKTFPALPMPTINVHTVSGMDSRSYSATNSPKAIQGDHNTLTDSSINIGQSFNQKQERIAALDDLLGKLKTTDNQAEPVLKAAKELGKVRDELADEEAPNPSNIKKWMERSKQLLSSAALSYEIVEGAKKLYELFGV